MTTKKSRAYSLLKVRSVDDTGDEERIIEGIATTPATDSYGDSVDPMGAKFETPMPLLWQHMHDQPVGWVEFAEPSEEGIPFRARIAKIAEPGALKDLVDKAWHSIKYGLVGAVSIGFQSDKFEQMDGGGLRFKEWEWYELSLVTIPANREATISAVRSIDRKLRSASGAKVEKAKGKPQKKSGVSLTLKNSTSQEGKDMSRFNEKMKQLRAKRAETVARMKELAEAADEAGETMDEVAAEEFAELESLVAQLDAEAKRLKTLFQLETADELAPVDGDDTEEASKSRQGQRAHARGAQVRESKVPGGAFARFVGAMAAARGNRSEALAYAKSKFPNDTRLHKVIKAAVDSATTTDPNWAGALVEYTTMADEFLEWLRPKTLLGQFGQNGIPSLRRVPFNVRIRTQSATAGGYWVGESYPKPVTSAGFDNITLGFAKVANIAVLSEELLRFSSPNAEELVRDELGKALIERLDIDFVDPSKAAGTGATASPASITNGVTPLPSTGDVDQDVAAAFGSFIAANQDPTSAVWIMDSVTALAISQKRSPLGEKLYPELSMKGGTFEGLPAVVSNYVPVNSQGHLLILVNAADILLADDGSVVVDASREATIEMSDTPSGTATRSMWQHNEIALRAERFINWRRARDSAVVVIEGVNYGAPTTP